MDWFWYAVVLPFGALLLGLAGCVLYWLIKHDAFKEIAKSAGSYIEEGSSVPESPSSDPVTR